MAIQRPRKITLKSLGNFTLLFDPRLQSLDSVANNLTNLKKKPRHGQTCQYALQFCRV